MGAAVTLPERVVVPTCMGCGAMGRAEGCEGACSEHRLDLVRAAELEALEAAAAIARARVARLAPLARRLAGDPPPGDPDAAFAALRDDARAALRALAAAGPAPAWGEGEAVTGWWCAECGNVDVPRPCIGVCVWRPAGWVRLDVVERAAGRAAPAMEADAPLSRVLSRLAAVRPRAGQAERNWRALGAHAAVALAAPGAAAA
ncbi:hypothetical protein [Miltoncostaea marina]|uniref:hypothetical protein n=1 Tax=Miltoncostaea marina TaxID=2843215 RepID=UPI001C3D7643|nr:hypothetical protein [Miltoncostaea marina]